MTRVTAKDFDPEVLKLFDKYVHGQLNRRGQRTVDFFRLQLAACCFIGEIM